MQPTAATGGAGRAQSRKGTKRYRPMLPREYTQQSQQQNSMDSLRPSPAVSIRIVTTDDVTGPVNNADAEGGQRKWKFSDSMASSIDSPDTRKQNFDNLQRRRNSRPPRESRSVRTPGFFRNLVITPRLSPTVKKREDVVLTPLMKAYYDGKLAVLEGLINSSNLYECHRGSQTLADIAASDGYLYVLDILHNKGVNFNQKNPENYVPLHYAVENQQTRAMRKLIVLGANPNIPLPSGEYALHRACGFQTTDVLSCLLEICKADSDVIDRQSNSPLHRACLEDSVPHTKKLLEHCTQDVVNMRGYEGKTALHIAVINQNRKITTMLLNSGAFVDIPSDSKKTVIDQVLGLGNVVLMSDLAYFFTQEMTKSDAHSFSQLFEDPQFQQYLNFLDAVDNEYQVCQIQHDSLSLQEEAELLTRIEKDDKIDLIEFKEVVLKLLQTEAIHVLLEPSNKDMLLKTSSNIVRYVLFREDVVMLERIMTCGLVWFEIRAQIEAHIDELYVHTPNRGNNGVVTHFNNNFIVDHQLNREALTHFYAQKCSNFKLRAYREPGFHAQADYMRHPMDTLVMWSIFTGRFKLTEILLRQEKFDVVPLGLYCASVLRSFIAIPNMTVDAADMEQLASTCEMFAAQTVKNVYQLDTSTNKQTTVEYLLLSLPTYGEVSCIQLAARNSSAKFLQTLAGQEALNKSWFGFLLHINAYLRELIIWMGLIPCNLLIPIILLYLEKRYAKKAEDIDDNNIFNEESTKPAKRCDFLLPESQKNPAEEKMTPLMMRRTYSSELLRPQNKKAHRHQSLTSLHSLASSFGGSNSSLESAHQDSGEKAEPQPEEDAVNSRASNLASYCSKENICLLFSLLYGFYRIPAVKFRYHAMSHIVLLLLLSYIVLMKFEYSLSAAEVIAYLIIFGFLMEELAEFVQYRMLHETISDFFSSKWNIIDLLALLSAVIGFSIRMQRSEEKALTDDAMLDMTFDDTLWYCARLFLGTSCMLYWVRLLYISTVLEVLGPKLKMIATMIIKDMMPFLFILFIFILGFGVLIHGLLFPNGYYAWNSDKLTTVQVLVNMFRICFYSMVGEYSLDMLEGNSECDAIYSNNSKNEKNCPHQYGRYLVPNLVMPLYVIITEILLLNLIIALFSKTIDKIDSRSKALWQFERHELIEEFQSRSCLPPPFNIADILRRLFRRLYKVHINSITGRKYNEEKEPLDKELVLQFMLYQAFTLRNNREKLMASSSPKEETENDELLSKVREIIQEELVRFGKSRQFFPDTAVVAEARIDSIRGTLMEAAPVKNPPQKPQPELKAQPVKQQDLPVKLPVKPQLEDPPSQEAPQEKCAFMALMETDTDLEDYDAI